MRGRGDAFISKTFMKGMNQERGDGKDGKWGMDQFQAHNREYVLGMIKFTVLVNYLNGGKNKAKLRLMSTNTSI